MFGLCKNKEKTSQPRILVVDDDVDLVDIIQRRLEYYQWKVIAATNGKEGLEKAANEVPDVIVLDINMPVMNGHEMLRQLRQHPNLKDIPVIMCSISCDVQDITTASSYNISDYVTKPFDCMELIEKTLNILENRCIS